MHKPPENPSTCTTPSSSFPSSDQYLGNVVAFAPLQLFMVDLAEGTETTSGCHGGMDRTRLDRLLFSNLVGRPQRGRPTRLPSGSCFKCASAEEETDCTPVCFVLCLSLVICGEYCRRDWYLAYGRHDLANVLKQRSLRYAFVRDRRVLCLFIYVPYTCAAPGESVASDNELITWFIYGLLLGSLPNTTWFRCSI